MLVSKCCLASRLFPVLLATLGMAWAVNSHAATKSVGLQALYKQAVASPNRTDDDRGADAKRKPLEFLQFTEVRPGMRVLDIAAGGGYTTQLLALVVGNNGTVWAQEPELQPALLKRVTSSSQSNIIPVIVPYDDPVPNAATDLDLITIIFNYHDIAYMPVDRAMMNKRLFNALKPGGHLVVLDHSAKAGSGISDAKTLHRIEEKVVVDEFEKAGFKLEKSGDFLRNPADPRDQPFFKMQIPTDKFALRFVKLKS
jgi:predicted methyltransferase